MIAPADGGRSDAVHLRFGSPGREILAPLGPGRLVPLAIRDCHVLERGETIELRAPGTVAFDGEREVVLRDTERARIQTVDGSVRVLDVAGLLRTHAGREATANTRSQDTTQGGP